MLRKICTYIILSCLTLCFIGCGKKEEIEEDPIVEIATENTENFVVETLSSDCSYMDMNTLELHQDPVKLGNHVLFFVKDKNDVYSVISVDTTLHSCDEKLETYISEVQKADLLSLLLPNVADETTTYYEYFQKYKEVANSVNYVLVGTKQENLNTEILPSEVITEDIISNKTDNDYEEIVDYEDAPLEDTVDEVTNTDAEESAIFIPSN